MTKNSKTFDVIILNNHRDQQFAATVASVFQSFGLEVFLGRDDVAVGDDFEDVIWQAIAESRAVVVISPQDELSSSVAFELGAARAWNKPIYVVTPDGLSRLPIALQKVQALPLSRVEEIARLIQATSEPLSENDQQYLLETYQKTGVSVDQLATTPHLLAKLTKDFSKRTQKSWAIEDVLSLLLRIRKRGRLPSSPRTQKKSAV